MKKLLLQPTSTAQWQALVNEAETACAAYLDQDIESYLVFTLMRFTDKPEIVKSMLGMEFLEGVDALGPQQHELLRDVGDKCLLYSGLFPEHAQKRRVSVDYFVDVGQSAYGVLTELPEKIWRGPYPALCKRFVSMMDVLQTMRDIDNPEANLLEPLMAAELWQATGSQRALRCLRHYSQDESVIVPRHVSSKRLN